MRTALEYVGAILLGTIGGLMVGGFIVWVLVLGELAVRAALGWL